MTQRAVIRSLPQAYEVIKQMNLSPEWDLDYRFAARGALVRILEDRMNDRIDRYLEETGRLLSDRRNGCFSRHLLTELGDIKVHIPRTMHLSTVEVVRYCGRRVGHVDRMIVACFILGLSTRKVAHALMPVLGESVSATTEGVFYKSA
jgi:transposase-like protein